MAKRYWLMKTEPDVFSFEDLVKLPKKTTHWEGVRNYQARNYMRDDFQVGDGVLIYHSNTEEPAVVGIGEVSKGSHPDIFALDPKSKYFDEDAQKKANNPWVMVEIRAVSRLNQPVTREVLKRTPALEKMVVLQKGSRLSVQPVTEEDFVEVCRLGVCKPL